MQFPLFEEKVKVYIYIYICETSEVFYNLTKLNIERERDIHELSSLRRITSPGSQKESASSEVSAIFCWCFAD